MYKPSPVQPRIDKLLEWKKTKEEETRWTFQAYMKTGREEFLDHLKYHREVLIEIITKIKDERARPTDIQGQTTS